MPYSGQVASLPEPIDETPPPNNPVIIHPQGDLLLHVNFCGNLSWDYRVSISALREKSAYFSALLDGSKFSEGIAVESRLTGLRTTYTDMASPPISELPRVTLSDVGVGPNPVHSAVEAAFNIFLEILHGSPPEPKGSKAHIRMLYAVTVYFADRFAAINVIRSYILNHWTDALCMKFNAIAKSATKSSKEVKARQMLYIGLVLDCPSTVEHYSAALVIWGSTRWLEMHEERSTAGEEGFPWDYLDGGVEGTFWASFLVVLAQMQ
ncbi:MAG: hypothetical protein Q9188_001967 [Gyalolechia gomerana]